MKKTIIAIDPGNSGGIAVYEHGMYQIYKMPETPMDILNLFRSFKETSSTICYIEKVHAYPKQGVVSVWTFSANFHYLIMALLVCEIPTEMVLPNTWMKTMGLGTRGEDKGEWKRKLKQLAQQLYPSIKITLWNADALLLLNYAIKIESNKQ